MMKRVVMMLMVVGLVSVSQAVLIDDFQGYTEAGSISDDTAGVWTEIGTSGNPDIADDGAGNLFITNYKNGGWPDQVGTYRSLGANAVANGQTVTLEFDMMAATNNHDMSFGLANGGDNTAWNDMEAYVTIKEGDVKLRGVDGGLGLGEVVADDVIVAGQWHHFKLIVDTDVDNFDLYLDDALLWTGAPFRNGVDVEDLDAVKLIGYGGVDGEVDYVAIDNITLVPEPATMALLGLGALVLRRKR